MIVFWPVDVTASGLCYGWRDSSTITVAGVLSGTSAAEARMLLDGYNTCHAQQEVVVLLGSCHVEPRTRYPSVRLDLSEGGGSSSKQQALYYRRPPPRSMKFYSFDRLHLDFDQRPEQGSEYAFGHDFTRVQKAPASGLNPRMLRQFNRASAVQAALSRQSNSRAPRLDMQDLRHVIFPLTEVIRHGATHLLHVCAIPVTFDGPQGMLLKDVSAIVQQMDIRAEQSAFLSDRLWSVTGSSGQPPDSYISQYISFYNHIWLILNDIIVGSAVGAFLCENHVILAGLSKSFIEDILLGFIPETLIWLDNWPAGLKLNGPLSTFYSHTFIRIMGIWGKIVLSMVPFLPSTIYLIGVSGTCGLTMALSVLSDLLSFMTLHLYLCYIVATAVFAAQLQTAGSLWNLFRGKRFNVLRNRIDSWDYDLDQLLLGTILFTLLAFLFPTVLAYYALFATTRVAVIFFHATVETFLAAMNHFPLFVLMLRLKDPWRLPGGVYLKFVDGTFSVENQPIPVIAIFSQYIHLWSRLSAHYHPWRILRRLLTGKSLTPIPRYSIRYRTTP